MAFVNPIPQLPTGQDQPRLITVLTDRLHTLAQAVNSILDFQFSGFTWSASSVDSIMLINTGSRLFVASIRARVLVAGTDAGAVTAVIRKVPTGAAITAGTALHSGSVNLKGTVNANQILTMSGSLSTRTIEPGDAIAIDFTGVLTAASGQVSVEYRKRTAG